MYALSSKNWTTLFRERCYRERKNWENHNLRQRNLKREEGTEHEVDATEGMSGGENMSGVEEMEDY